jgi:N utilization substance protein B
MTSRRHARALALQLLCFGDRQPDLDTETVLRLFFAHLTQHEDDAESPQIADKRGRKRSKGEPASSLASPTDEEKVAAALVRGVRENLPELDELLSRCSRNWRLERMSWVDRNLLRLACYELSESAGPPAKVVLNEAIELARTYSTSDSPGFVNGILDRAMRELAHDDLANRPLPSQGGSSPSLDESPAAL